MTTTLGPSEDEIAELIGDVARHQDRAAFIRLFEFYAPRLKRHVMRFQLTADAAEDVVQDVMLTLWAKAQQFDPARGNPSAWIFTLATNARIDRQRRETRARRVAASDLEVSAQPDIETAVIDAEAGDHVAAALKELSPPQRAIVEMSFFQDAPHSAIAARLGIPLGTVKSRIRLAMEKLRQALGDPS